MPNKLVNMSLRRQIIWIVVISFFAGALSACGGSKSRSERVSIRPGKGSQKKTDEQKKKEAETKKADPSNESGTKVSIKGGSTDNKDDEKQDISKKKVTNYKEVATASEIKDAIDLIFRAGKTISIDKVTAGNYKLIKVTHEFEESGSNYRQVSDARVNLKTSNLEDSSISFPQEWKTGQLKDNHYLTLTNIPMELEVTSEGELSTSAEMALYNVTRKADGLKSDFELTKMSSDARSFIDLLESKKSVGSSNFSSELPSGGGSVEFDIKVKEDPLRIQIEKTVALDVEKEDDDGSLSKERKNKYIETVLLTFDK